MSSTTHSFNPSRHSNSFQLPLPPSLNASSPQRPQGGTTISNIAGPSSPTASTFNTRAPSSLSSRPLTGDATSPTTANFPFSQTAHSSSTHAGGIQPSASFFRPSRPTQQYSRPSSSTSTNEVPLSAPAPDIFQLAPLARLSSNSSDEPGSMTAPTLDETNSFPSMKRLKQSREPLLPIGGRRPSLASRPSGVAAPTNTTLSREHNGLGALTSSTSNLSTTGRLMRNSIDRMRTLGRGLSFESIRKPNNISTGGTDRRMTFDSKITDEEQGLALPLTPTRISHSRKNSSSPVNQSLNISNTHPSPTNSPSPDPSFIPCPPDNYPPLASVPMVDPVSGKRVKRYQLHPSSNKFFFGGRLLTGGDSPWAFMASFGLVLGISGVWFGSTCVWWWHNESPAVAIVGAYMALLTISSMLATAMRDPGILPRNLDPEPPYPSTSPSDGGVRAPMPRDLKVRSDVVRVKYCPTCKTYRPPRASHCKMCDNCVDACDHHCQWVNNCVGRRNYTCFLVLLLSATITLILIICTSALHLYLLTRREDINFRHALNRGAGSAVAFSLSIAVIWPVAALLSYHMRLLLLNVTTIEQIRNQAHKTLIPGAAPANPFSHGHWRRNVVAVLCRPVGASWLDGAGIATEDKREVNPGLGEVWEGRE